MHCSNFHTYVTRNVIQYKLLLRFNMVLLTQYITLFMLVIILWRFFVYIYITFFKIWVQKPLTKTKLNGIKFMGSGIY